MFKRLKPRNKLAVEALLATGAGRHGTAKAYDRYAAKQAVEASIRAELDKEYFDSLTYDPDAKQNEEDACRCDYIGYDSED